MNQEKIGGFIREKRKEKNMTQQELADNLGVTNKSISKWETGRCLMDLSLIKPLCEILDITILELLNGEKVKEENINILSNKTLENTLLYTKQEIKKQKKKDIKMMKFLLLLIFTGIYITYQSYNLMRYSTNNKLNNYIQEGIKEKLKPKGEIEIYKKTIPEEEYIGIQNIKIKNYFNDIYIRCLPEITRKEVSNYHCSFYSTNNKMEDYGISIIRSYNNLEIFKNEMVQDLYKQNYLPNVEEFILLNDINNDIDFIKYVNDNGYKSNNVFTSKKEMELNFAYNNFITSSFRHLIGKEYILINGDYKGYYYEEKVKGIKQRCAVIIKDKYNYSIISRNEKIDKEVIIDIISTLEIR